MGDSDRDTIKKGAPIPGSRTTLAGRKRNPATLSGKIRALKRGESRWFDKPQTTVSAAADMIRRRQKTVKHKYTTRSEDGGCRIWRVA